MVAVCPTDGCRLAAAIANVSVMILCSPVLSATSSTNSIDTASVLEVCTVKYVYMYICTPVRYGMFVMLHVVSCRVDIHVYVVPSVCSCVPVSEAIA